MKRPVVTAVILFAIAGLAGCPIYSHDDEGCYQDSDCAQGYVCNDYNGGDCVAAVTMKSCTKPSDCDSTYTCTPAGVCQTGDCTFSGCIAGYTCDASSGTWGCVPNGSGAAGSSGQAGAGDTAGAAGQGSAGGQGGAGGQSAAAAGAADSSGGVAGG